MRPLPSSSSSFARTTKYYFTTGRAVWFEWLGNQVILKWQHGQTIWDSNQGLPSRSELALVQNLSLIDNPLKAKVKQTLKRSER